MQPTAIQLNEYNTTTTDTQHTHIHACIQTCIVWSGCIGQCASAQRFFSQPLPQSPESGKQSTSHPWRHSNSRACNRKPRTRGRAHLAAQSLPTADETICVGQLQRKVQEGSMPISFLQVVDASLQGCKIGIIVLWSEWDGKAAHHHLP